MVDAAHHLVVDTPLLRQAAELRDAAHGAVEPRLAALVERRIRELIGVPVVAREVLEPDAPSETSPADESALDLAEQFVIDVHGITDERFAVVAELLGTEPTVALMFHMAMVDGFAKLERAAGEPLPTDGDRVAASSRPVAARTAPARSEESRP